MERDGERRAWAITTLGSVALAILLSITESADPDLGFHVATGRAVLESGSIPATNVLSFEEPDHPWINQQWLPATALAIAFDRAGFAGTLALKILAIALTTALLVATARRLGARPAIAGCAIALGTWAAAFRFVERPLLASNLALAVVLWALAAAWSDRARARRWIAVAGLAASAAIHLHAGAIFSLIALAVLALACALEPLAARIARRDPGVPARAAVPLAVAAILAVALAAPLLALYHPYGLEVLAVPLRMASDPYLREHLTEFRPPHLQPLRVLAPYWAFVAVCALGVLGAIRRAPLPWIAAIALGVAISLRHARFVDLAWILGAPALAAVVSRSAIAARAPQRAPAAIALAIALAAIVDRTTLSPPAVGGAPHVWPEPLFDVVARERLTGPAFVQDGWAGPFLARFWPRERVFFHPAFEAYSPEHYRLYQTIRYGEPGWREALDRYGVELVIMRHTSPRERELQGGRPNLRQQLAASPGWALIAADELGAIFARRGGANAAIADVSPSHVDPDRLAFTAPPEQSRAGLEATARRSPPSARVAILLAVARAADGDRAGAAALLDAVGPDPRAEAARRAISAP